MRVFYTLPTSIEAHPYLQWDRDPDAARYIQKLIGVGTPQEVEPIARILIERLESERGLDRQFYRDAIESISALQMQLFLSQQRGGWIETAHLTELQQPLSTFNPRSIALENPANKGLRNCSIALLAELLLSGRRGSWIRFDIFEKLEKYDTSIQLKDVYALGINILCDPKRFVLGFAPKATVNWYRTLRSWSDTKFRRSVVDGVRKETGLKYFKRTNLGILKLSSDTRVEQVLIAAGEQGNRLQGLLSIHQYLQETVRATTFDTKNPQPAHYAELLIQYNEHGGGSMLPIPDWESLKELLTSMGKILRSYEQPQIPALDTPLGNGEVEQTTTLGETLVGTAGNPFAAESASESTTDRPSSLETEDCQNLAIDLLQQLPSEQQRVLMFLDGLQLNQAETGLEVGCHQGNVNRQRDRMLLGIARKLHPLSTAELTAALLEEIIGALKEVYADYYPELLASILTDIAASNPPERVCQAFIDRIQAQWEFEFHPEGRGLSKATAFVESKSRLWRSNVAA